MPDPALPVFPEVRTLRLSPTDLSQFIRLEQCQRYLRLRLHERAGGDDFMAAGGVRPQAMPPLLTRSGSEFEERVEREVGERFSVRHLAEEAGGSQERPNDNARVLAEMRALPAGEVRVLFQVRLQAELEGWFVTGDVDLLRLERGGDDRLRVLVADMKSTSTTKVEHRLQVAFYQALLTRLCEEEGVAVAGIGTGLLYRGAAGQGETLAEPVAGSGAGPRAPSRDGDAVREERERAAARELFGVEALLEVVPDPEAYLDAVGDLVTGPEALARRVASSSFDALPFHLTHKCDGCVYNEFCMKWCAEQDDLSLIPHLRAAEKAALKRVGIATNTDLALLKEFRRSESAGEAVELVPAPGKEALCRQVATTWPVGPRVDELVHRARRYRRWKRDSIDALRHIPSKGYGSLPFSDAEHNPNLVRVYLDAQHDHLQDRVYMLGALVVACEAGVPARRRSIVHLADAPPEAPEAERELLLGWIEETLRAIVELAAPDGAGAARAPIHLIFFSAYEQKLFLDALARHTPALLGTVPALYEFMTQLAAYDSPIATFLDAEIRELKNYSMLCQSLQAVAAYLRFDWNAPERFTELFRERMFDTWGKLESEGAEPGWYAARCRFSSQIPLEYAYAAWDALPPPPAEGRDDYASYRATTPELLRRFHARRLEALECVAADFDGNRFTEKRPFDLPDLASFSDRARSLAQALDEFVTIERHAELHAWKMARHASPERRVLMGETLLARYREADQEPAAAEQNRENERRRLLKDQLYAGFRQARPEAARVQLSKEQKAESDWSQEGLRLRLRLETEGLDCSLDEALALRSLNEGDRCVLFRRWTSDERLPPAERTLFQPTPKQMLYGTRAELSRLDLERDAGGHVIGGFADIVLQSSFYTDKRGFVFKSMDRPLIEGERYTLDPCPNSYLGYWSSQVTEGLWAIAEGRQHGCNTLYERLAHPPGPLPVWPPEAVAGQQRFLAGLDALREAGVLHDFEASKREYIGAHGEAPMLLVQGPPGTGKSYSTAFALLARMQGALAAGRDFRACVSCKTHAATDVLLGQIRRVQHDLRTWQKRHPEIYTRFFEPRLLQVPLYRLMPKDPPPDGIIPLIRDEDKSKGERKNREILRGERCCVVGATPGGIYRLPTKENRFSTPLFDCLILDEASQMSLPEAAMAALPLRPDGQLIVVGDHRQMPPIVQHDWETEPRRTFQEYRAYESLFMALLPLDPPVIRFQESFRLHADMAEFLRREVYEQDDIPYFSKERTLLPGVELADDFARAVLAPQHPIVVVLHEEAASQNHNPFEETLIAPLLEALADPARYGLDATTGLGVVVPHRAQRAALRLSHPCLAVVDPQSGRIAQSAVDTVERFQGGERSVILISATESDREYLLVSSKFLLDPRRLTVALSRARQKLVLVAARSVFSLFSPDEETFAHSQIWKNLLRRTCTVSLWEGERDGVRVEVWGNEVGRS
jgi:AAA domain/PD-(D/E)XK nuclease superfamily